MDPAFPDIVGQKAAGELEDRSRVWIVERGADGRLEERIDPSFLALIEENLEVDGIVEALIVATAEQHIEETRIW